MLTVDQKPLLAALGIAARAAETRTTIPILSCLRIAAKGGRMLILGTNLDLWVDVECEAQGKLGPVCPSAQRLLAAVKAAGPGELRIEERPTGLFIRHAAGKALLPLLPADDFPTGRQPEGGSTIKVTAAEWARAVALIEPSISTEASRLYLNGASLRANRGRLLLAATDGHRLDRVALDAELGGDEPDAIIPRAGLQAMKALAGDVTMQVDRGLVRAECTGLAITSRLIDGAFPDYERIIPAPGKPLAKLSAADLIASVERIAWATAEDAGRAIGLRLRPGEPALLWAAMPNDAAATATLDCEVMAEADIGFNSGYLASLMSRLGGDEIELHGSASNPCRFVRPGSDDGHVIMPCRIQPYQPTAGMSDE
jgi:DNA polymerase-3 subunit beta